MMRRKPSRKGDRPIEFLNGRVVVFICAEFEKICPTWQDEWGAVIRVYDDAGNVIATHEKAGDFKEP